MTVPDAKRLKDLELENSRLKKLLAESLLDIGALKVVTRGKGEPGSGAGGQEMQAQTDISERRACQLFRLSRSVLCHQPRTSVQNTELQAQLVELARASALWLSPPAHSAAACWCADQLQADLPAIPSRRLDGEAAEAPPQGRGGVRMPEPAERTELGLVDGFRLRRAQHWATDQMPDGGR